MTSPAASPQSFHRRPNLAPDLPPARHLVYLCSRCRKYTLHFHQHCDCAPTALLHAVEIDLATYTRLRAAA